MTAEQIRAIGFEYGYSKPNDEPTFTVLREIAAQLAEINKKLQQAAAPLDAASTKVQGGNTDV